MSVSQWLSAIEWQHPAGWWLAAMPLLFWFVGGLRVRRELSYAEAALRPWAIHARRGAGSFLAAFARAAVCIAGWGLLAAALAGPRLEQLHTKNAARRDISRAGVSLMAVVQVPFDDQGPVARAYLERVWTELQDLSARLRGERLGLIAYNGRAGVLTMPTSDRAAFRFYLRRAGRVMTGWRGDALGEALARAREVLAGNNAAHHSEGIILVAAGGAAPNPTALRRAVAGLRAAHMPVYALDMNSFAAALLAQHPHSRAFGVPAFGAKAAPLAPDRRWLHKVVRATGGVYARVEDGDGDWRRLYDDGAARLPVGPAGHEAGEIVRSWHELYGWFLAPALLLLLLDAGLLEVCLSGVARLWRRRRDSLGHMTVLALLALSVAGWGWPAPVSAVPRHRAKPMPLSAPASVRNAPGYASAYNAYRAHDYALAQFGFAGLAGYAARLGEGASAYRRGDYDQAVRQFTAALLAAGDTGARATALFDLGNAHFRQHDYRRAVSDYEGALSYSGRGQDTPIRANLWRAQAALIGHTPKPHVLAADSGLPPRNGAPPEGFPDETPPNISSVRQGAASALARRVARGQLAAAPEGGGNATGASPSRQDGATDAGVLKLLELVGNHTTALLRGVIAHTPPPVGMPVDGNGGDSP